jgi:hypothetical protein
MNCTARGRLNITRHPLPHEALQCRYRKLSVLARFACYIVFVQTLVHFYFKHINTIVSILCDVGVAVQIKT